VEPRTHLAIDRRWSGAPVELREGAATVSLATLPEMAADDRGLVHGGFVFALADHAAMLAVNEPTVVLAAAAVEFLAPVKVGEELVATAELEAPRPEDGKRRRVRCSVRGAAGEVFRGDFTCAVPARHVFDRAPAARNEGRGG
jgi:acyl-coenzyme A thioesterase PaaI-like protein